MDSTSKDRCAEWAVLAEGHLTLDNIQETLKTIRDDLWVAAACVDSVASRADVQRSLLELGLERTAEALERAKDAFEFPSSSTGDEDTSGEELNVQTGAEKRLGSLVAHFNTKPADAQLCHVRAILLERLDRLNTFVEIWKDEAAQKGDANDEMDEWEDDPWADDGAAEQSVHKESAASRGPPLPLSDFLLDDLVDIGCLLASQQQFTALRILLQRHGLHLWQYRFTVLEAIPEYAHPSEFRDLLPAIDISADAEQAYSFCPWRPEADWSETIDVQNAIKTSSITVTDDTAVHGDMEPHAEPLSSLRLTNWYKMRVDTILSSTGMIDVALATVQHGASQGVSDLDELGEELSLLSRLVYDAHGAEMINDDEWTLSRWMALNPLATVRAYLAHSTPDTLARDIPRFVMPYLFVLESRAERAGHADPGLPDRLLYEYIITAPLDMAVAVFEASKVTLPAAQRLIRNEEDIVRLALACLYGSDSLNKWDVMSRIFECLPAWEMAPDETEEDEADATVTSLGAFVTPSATHPTCTPSDLLIFFNPLPLKSLSRALDILDVHLESGEILARWNVSAPLRWFLQSSSDITEQRSWANRMARRAGVLGEALDSQDKWNRLLDDMLKLSSTGESGLKGAFGLLDRKEILQIFFGGLLSSGQFNVAKDLLRTLSLDAEIIEDICLSNSQEFYDNANSGNYKFGDMKLAYECLDVPPLSDRLLKEKEFIEATSRLSSFNVMSRPGIPITPIEIRLTKDRLSLVSRVLSSNTDAYKHTQVILDLVYKLGFRNNIVAEVKTLAMLADTALQVEDFARAYETSEKMVDTVLNLRSSTPLGLDDPVVVEASEVCWVACFQLGRQPEFDDVSKKLCLLGRGLELCPADKVHDVLVAWRRLEKDTIKERRERLANRGNSAAVIKKPRQPLTSAATRTASSLAERLQDFHFPASPLVNAPDAAALANRAFNRVAGSFPFGNRGRSTVSNSDATERSRSGSRRRLDTEEVSSQASRVLSKGIGWLIGADDE